MIFFQIPLSYSGNPQIISYHQPYHEFQGYSSYHVRQTDT